MQTAFKAWKTIIEPLPEAPKGSMNRRYVGKMVKNHELGQKVFTMPGEHKTFHGRLKPGEDFRQAQNILEKLGTRLKPYTGGLDGVPPINVSITHDGQGNVQINVHKNGRGGGFTFEQLSELWHPEMAERKREAR